MPGKEEGRKENGEEQEQGKASQQLVLPTLGGYNDPSSFAELDLVRIRGAHGEGGGAASFGEANDRKRTLSNSPSRERLPMEEDACL